MREAQKGTVSWVYPELRHREVFQKKSGVLFDHIINFPPSPARRYRRRHSQLHLSLDLLLLPPHYLMMKCWISRCHLVLSVALEEGFAEEGLFVDYHIS